MIDERIDSLINEELDGTASPEEAAQLREILSTHAEARGYYEDLRRLSSTLAASELEEPPSALKANILRVVEAPGAAPWEAARSRPSPPSRASWLKDMIAGIGRRPALTGSMLFATGAAAGIGIFSLFEPSTAVDESAVTAVMGPAAVRKIAPTASRSFELEGILGSVTTRLTETEVVVEMNLHAPDAVAVQVNVEGGGVLLGFWGSGLPDPRATLGPEGAQLTHRGDGAYFLTWQRIPGSLPEIVIHLETPGGTHVERVPAAG